MRNYINIVENMNTDIVSPELRVLRACFQKVGFDIRIVGGAVRDMLRGIPPKDIDLCTDATPDEQIEIYKANGFSYFETGLAHGTISVRAGVEIYEITSLRTESDHDGRHAVVHYTRDWLEDLGRRDLTVNAMAMTFDGDIIDPFHGQADLETKRVRFVGNPDDRMREDYLRILRWLRFAGRIANGHLDPATMAAASRNAKGLQGISRERIWMEFAKIISGNNGHNIVEAIYTMGLAPFMGLPNGNVQKLAQVWNMTKNPITLMVALLDEDVSSMPVDWKWSTEERDLALFLMQKDMMKVDRQSFKAFVARDGFPKPWVMELALLNGNPSDASFIENWIVPVFPVKGQDLINSGMKAGPMMGQALKTMKDAWTASDFTMTKDQLLSAGE